jgi:hypothetical protein
VSAAALQKDLPVPPPDGPAMGRALHDARMRAIADGFAGT